MAQQQKARPCHEHDTWCHSQTACTEEAGTKQGKAGEEDADRRIVVVAAQQRNTGPSHVSHYATASRPVTADHPIAECLAACQLTLVSTSFKHGQADCVAKQETVCIT